MNYTPYMMNPNNIIPYQQMLSQQLYNYQMNQYPYNQQMSQQMNQMSQQNNQPYQMNNQYDFIGAFVSNFEEVKGYPIPMGSSVLLMEKGNSKFYIKALDNNGNPLISTFRFEEYIEAPKQPAVVENNNQDQINYLEEINKIKQDNNNLRDNIDKALGIVDNRLKTLESKGGKS